MKLEEKGPIIKPPILEGPSQKVSVEVQSWTDVVSATHWTIGDSTKPNGADFYVLESELGHIHLDGEIHLSLTKPLRRALIAAGLADPFPWGENWVQFQIIDQESVRHAEWLFRIGYDRLKGASVSALTSRICERVSR